MTFPRTLLPLSLLAVLAGCSKAEQPAPAPAASASAAEPTAKNADVPTVDAGGNAAPLPPTAMMSIPQRFQSEATNRPTGVPTVEDVLGAFEKEGAKIREKAQHLGAPFLAKYCVGAQTGEDIHMSVCEYADATIAAKGLHESQTAFGTVANRTLYQNGGTTLTIRLGKNGPEDQALAKKLIEAFKKVPATKAAAPAASAKTP